MPHRSRQLAALVIAVLALAGCQDGADPNAAPSTAAPTAGASASCNHPPDTGGGDGGLGAGWDYAESHHDFGTAAPITLCMDLDDDDMVRMTGSSPEVTVEPETLDGPGTRFTFSVTVQPGATGDLDVAFVNEAGDVGMTFHGPAIVTDVTGWSFGPWG